MPRRNPFNPLQLLKRDVLEQQRADAEAHKRAKAAGIVQAIRWQSQYEDPSQWREGRVLQLVHITGPALGLYREYFHITIPATRRLLPASPDALAEGTETVSGDFWLKPYKAPRPAEHNEDAAIRQRFDELVREDEQT